MANAFFFQTDEYLIGSPGFTLKQRHPTLDYIVM
jgi:hypothetical protein